MDRLAVEKYDVASFYMTEMAQYLPASYRGGSVWSMEDPLVLKYERLNHTFPWYARPLLRERTKRRQRYERKESLRFDRVLVLNEADARDYAAVLAGARLDWVPYGIDIAAFQPDPDTPRRSGQIVISGNMHHPPNAEAADRFCRDVYPRVRAARPDSSLCLVGADPQPRVQKWNGREGIRVTGAVPDLRPYLREAMVSVCAVTLAIGTQTKVLEAMACGTPVVTTTAGNRGIQGVSGRHLHVADRPDEMASWVVRLLDGDGWAMLAENGRRFVVENFTWDRALARLEAVFAEVRAEAAGRD
jgi:glycosyltransferase involved in cell wall biosynthesis